MNLGQRIRLIIFEQQIKQCDFAKSLGVSANYINLVVNNKKNNISDLLAKCIEETYGYSTEWILYGTGEKLAKNNLTSEVNTIIKKVQKMSDKEIGVVLTFVNTLESMSNHDKTND